LRNANVAILEVNAVGDATPLTVPAVAGMVKNGLVALLSVIVLPTA
jgi:hypothetical protein